MKGSFVHSTLSIIPSIQFPPLSLEEAATGC